MFAVVDIQLNAALLHSNYCTLPLYYATLPLLIEKGGGIRPKDVLATCAYKVLHSTQTGFKVETDKRKRNPKPNFDISQISC